MSVAWLTLLGPLDHGGHLCILSADLVVVDFH